MHISIGADATCDPKSKKMCSANCSNWCSVLQIPADNKQSPLTNAALPSGLASSSLVCNGMFTPPIASTLKRYTTPTSKYVLIYIHTYTYLWHLLAIHLHHLNFSLVRRLILRYIYDGPLPNSCHRNSEHAYLYVSRLRCSRPPPKSAIFESRFKGCSAKDFFLFAKFPF